MSLDDSPRAEILDLSVRDVRTRLTVIRMRVHLLTRELDRGQWGDSDQLRQQLGVVAEQLQVMQRDLTELEECYWRGDTRTRPETASGTLVRSDGVGTSGWADQLIHQAEDCIDVEGLGEETPGADGSNHELATVDANEAAG